MKEEGDCSMAHDERGGYSRINKQRSLKQVE